MSRRGMVLWAVALLLLSGCAPEEAAEPETIYVPVPVQEQPAPEAPNPREEADARAEVVCDANGGVYIGSTCTYPNAPGTDVPCDTAFEQSSYTCKD